MPTVSTTENLQTGEKGIFDTLGSDVTVGQEKIPGIPGKLGNYFFSLLIVSVMTMCFAQMGLFLF